MAGTVDLSGHEAAAAEQVLLRAEIAGLRADVAALRTQVAALRPAAPTLRARSGGRWLGEAARLTVAAAAGTPLLVTAATGYLETAADGRPVAGRAVLLHTGARGQADVTWRPDAVLPLREGHRAALDARLETLGDAETPRAAADVLATLATDYLRTPARMFREAVDALWHDRHGVIDRLTDRTQPWPLVDAVLTVHALSASLTDGGSPAIVGSAALVLQVRDWLPALADAVAARVAATSTLASQLRTEAQRDTGAANTGAALQARLGTWIASRPGALGRTAAVEVAEAAVSAELRRIAEHPIAEREALVPLLSASAQAIREVAAPVLGAIEATGSVARRDTIDRITKLPTVDPRVLDGLAQRVDAVEHGLQTTDGRTGEALDRVERLSGQLDDRVTTAQLTAALTTKLDRAEGAKIERLAERVNRLERTRPP